MTPTLFPALTSQTGSIPMDPTLTGNPWKLTAKKFAFIKATEGQGYTNPYFEDDVKQAKEAGLRVGSYHFARPGESAALQAANYANTIRTMPQPSLPPVLDIESDDGVGPEEVQRWVKEFVTEVEALTGRTPMIYTYRYFWSEQMGDTTDFKDFQGHRHI